MNNAEERGEPARKDSRPCFNCTGVATGTIKANLDRAAWGPVPVCDPCRKRIASEFPETCFTYGHDLRS